MISFYNFPATRTYAQCENMGTINKEIGPDGLWEVNMKELGS